MIKRALVIAAALSLAAAPVLGQPAVPYTFGTQSGKVPASELDSDFSYVLNYSTNLLGGALKSDNNLSDLANVGTARTNLGLGTAAQSNTGTSGVALCLLNANCTWTGAQTFSGGLTASAIDNSPIGFSTPVGVGGNGFCAFNSGYGATTGTDGKCTWWTTRGHANWNVVQTNVPWNPTEWQIYTSAASGLAQSQAGTNQIVRTTVNGQSGVPFDSSWAGKAYFYFGGVNYKVASVTDSSHLTVQTPAGGAVSFASTATDTYFYTVTSTDSTCNVSGTAVTYVSGQPFIPFNGSLTVNGTPYPFTFNSPSSLTLGSSAGTLVNAACHQEEPAAGELSTLRLQSLGGGNEENFTIMEQANGPWLSTGYAGAGQYRPMRFSVGELPAATPNGMIELDPNATLGNAGWLTLGGWWSQGSYTELIHTGQNWVNHWDRTGATSGSNPSTSCRGADANVGCAFDTQGSANFVYTSHGFGNFELKVFGNGGACYGSLGSGASSEQFSAQGANCNLQLTPSGTGFVQADAPVKLKNYTVSTLPTCTGSAQQGQIAYVTDASGTPAWHAAPAGGGSGVYEVFCTGSGGWVYQ